MIYRSRSLHSRGTFVDAEDHAISDGYVDEGRYCELPTKREPAARRIAELSLEANFPLMASSANRSQQGTKYRAEDIEPEVRAVADVLMTTARQNICRKAMLTPARKSIFAT